MDGKKEILYIMGIDWDWIFQRPQIIEQHLEENYNVTVVFPRSILNAFRKSHTKYPADNKILWTLPLQEKNRFIGWISSLYSKRIFRNIEQYDMIVIGYPLYCRYISDTYTGKVIYDCMDNYEELYPDKKNVSKIIRWEKELIKRSDVVIVTANKLFEKINAYTKDKKIFLVRNGTENKVISTPRKPQLQERYRIGYFGAIAEWFDFNLIQESLEAYSDIEYHLIGPILKTDIPIHQRIILEGIVPHQKLYEVTREYSCLVMPFVINDIVEGVDPVKLYEYISMGKCIISIKYQEIERFEEYVYMYSNHKEFIKLLQDLKEKGFPPKYGKKQQTDFLAENSWEKRFEILDGILCETMQ